MIIIAEEPVHPAADGLLDPQETDAQRCSAHQTTPVCQGDLPAPYSTVLNTKVLQIPDLSSYSVSGYIEGRGCGIYDKIFMVYLYRVP